MCRSARLLEWLCGCVEHAEDRRFGGAGVGNMGFGGEVHKYSMGGVDCRNEGSAETAGVEDGSETRTNSTPVSATRTAAGESIPRMIRALSLSS